MNYLELARKRILERAVSELSEADKSAFVQLVQHQEVMDALRAHDATLQQLAESRRREWITNFGSDVSANVLTNFLFLLGAKILKR